MSINGVRRQTRLLRALLLAGIVGIGSELLLTAHTGDWQQQIPLYGLALGLATLVWVMFARGSAARRGLQASMLALAGCGVAGLVLHFQSNYEFKRELDADAGTWTLVARSLKSASPPALAPGALALLAGIGLISTCQSNPGRGDEGATE